MSEMKAHAGGAWRARTRRRSLMALLPFLIGAAFANADARDAADAEAASKDRKDDLPQEHFHPEYLPRQPTPMDPDPRLIDTPRSQVSVEEVNREGAPDDAEVDADADANADANATASEQE